MIAQTQRRLNLLDVMAFVAMAGTGLISLREVSPDDFLPFRTVFVSTIRHSLVGPFLPCGLVWTLAVLLLRFKHPRPPRRYLARQPGVVACAASVLAAAAGASALMLVMVARHYAQGDSIALTDRFATRFMEGMAPYMGFSVLAAWLVLVLNKMWRPEPSWIDRLGRVMGVFWIAMIPIFVWPSGRLIL